MPGPSVSVWRFVDRPEVGATVLLDMHNPRAGWKVSREDFDVSPPPLKRSIAQNAMTDGGIVTSASYDLRELRFTIELSAESEDWRAAQLKALEAELAKPSNLIMYQPRDNSFPVFFRTLRSDAFELDNQYIPGKVWKIPLSVLAEPFAIGTRHDVVVGQSVPNDPAAGTTFDITGVRGDSPAPAFARTGTGFGPNNSFVLAQRTQNNPAALTVWAQCEAGTLGTDTTVQANDATMSGTGSNFVRCTFATNTLVTRVTVTVPTATSSEALRGRYRVFVKLRRSANTSAFTMRYRVPGGSAITGPQVSYDTGLSNVWMIDLGVVEFPSPGPTPTALGYSGLDAGYVPRTLEIQAKRDTGTQNLDFDFVYLLPADERMCAFYQVVTTGSIVLDGPQDMTYGMASGADPFGATLANRTVDNAGGLIPRIGGLPMLVPGTLNRWYVLRPNLSVTASSTWWASYWPRWREVATS